MIVQAAAAVGDGRADALVSAGSTGPTLAAAAVMAPFAVLGGWTGLEVLQPLAVAHCLHRGLDGESGEGIDAVAHVLEFAEALSASTAGTAQQ